METMVGTYDVLGEAEAVAAEGASCRTLEPTAPKSEFANNIETYDMVAARERLSGHLDRLWDESVDPRNARLRLQRMVAELPELLDGLDSIERSEMAARLAMALCPYMFHSQRRELRDRLLTCK